jgi:hypothetical protein
MGIAARLGAQRPAFCLCSAAQRAHVGPTPVLSADDRDRPSGYFSNQHGQQPLHIEILDAKR